MMPGSRRQYLGPNSVNVFLTNLCNGSCPFCYLNNWTTDDAGKAVYMSHEDLGTLINWLKKSKIYRVKLAGGEPTLHPDMLDFVKEFIRNDIIVEGVLTNGLGETETYRQVAGLTGTNWLVNVRGPEAYSAAEWDLINRNLDLLRWKNEDSSVKLHGFDTSSLRRLCLAITFYEPGQDFAYIIDLAKKHGCPVIRYDVSRPSADKSNADIDFDRLVEIKPTLMEFVRSCVREGVKPGVDDALPFCIFTQKELMFLHLFSNFYSICIPHSDVFPDLRVVYCTSMQGILPSFKISDKTAGQMFKEFLSVTNRYREHKLSRCQGCYNYQRTLCQGYCLRYKADFLKPEEAPTEEKKRPRIRFPKLWR
jgi:hypothetical protein